MNGSFIKGILIICCLITLSACHRQYPNSASHHYVAYSAYEPYYDTRLIEYTPRVYRHRPAKKVKPLYRPKRYYQYKI